MANTFVWGVAAAAAYGLLSLRAAVNRAWRWFCGTEAPAASYSVLSAPASGEGEGEGAMVRAPSRTTFHAAGPFKDPICMAIVEKACACCTTCDMGAERVRMHIAFANVTAEPALDVYSLYTLLAAGQPFYGLLMSMAIFLPNYADLLQAEHFTAMTIMTQSLDRGFLTREALEHQRREGAFEAFMGAVIAVLALMRTPSLGSMAAASLLLNVGMSLAISLPAASRPDGAAGVPCAGCG